MAQHFLHRASSRDLSLFEVADLSSSDANKFLAEVRWGSAERTACIRCGAVDRHYFRANRLQWRCRECDCDFSVTSATVFQDRKVSLRHLIAAAFLYVSSANGTSALELARVLKISVKSAFVILSKFREVLVRNADLTPLDGLTQIDGAHFCGKPRKPNRRRKISGDEVMARLSAPKAKRVAAPPRVRPSKNSIERQKKRRVILVARQVSKDRGIGATRSIVGVALHENQAAGMAFADAVIAPGAEVWTDENAAYSPLSISRVHQTVNHGVEFVSATGINDNQCESFNSRMRRAEYGVFHGFRPKYLADYLWEFAWRDDNRRLSVRDRVLRILHLSLNSGRSLWWRGYWQRHQRSGELLFRLGHRSYFLDPSHPQAKARTSFRSSTQGRGIVE